LNTNRPRLLRRMTPTEWWGDARDARKSAKSGIPSAGELPPTPTGRQSEIGRSADIKIACLRRQVQGLTQQMEAELAHLNEQICQLDTRIETAIRTEADFLARRAYRLPAEANVPDDVVQSRRAADNRKEAAPLRQRIDAMTKERDELAARVAQVDHDIVMWWRQARSCARAIGELARRREARYWRLLCRRHPDGARLAASFDHPRITLAPWVEGPADERSL